MTRRTCTRCGRAQSDAGMICHRCTRDLCAILRRIADLWPNLTQAIARQTVMLEKAEGKPTKRDAQPLPVDLRASEVAGHARGVLAGWVRVLCEDNPIEPPENRVPHICRWLEHHRGILRMHEAAEEACEEITGACGRIVRAVDYPDDRSRVHVGPCPEVDDDGDPCPGEVSAIIPEREGGSPRIVCGCCATAWDATQWSRLGGRVARRQQQIDRQKTWAS